MHKKTEISLTDVLAQYNNGLVARQVNPEKLPNGPSTMRRFKGGLVVIVGNGECDLADFGDAVFFAIVK